MKTSNPIMPKTNSLSVIIPEMKQIIANILPMEIIESICWNGIRSILRIFEPSCAWKNVYTIEPNKTETAIHS